MLKNSLIKLRILIVIPLLLITIGIGRAQTQPVFRIGVLGEERGAISNGARLAVQEINNTGGVQGADGTVFRLELVIQSTNGGENLTGAIANLRQASVIAIVGPETSEETLSSLAALQSLNVPVLTPATGDTIIASDSTGRIFRTRAAENLLGRALASYIIGDLSMTRITTVQLDILSTASVIGFSNAASALGAPPQDSLLLESGMAVSQIVGEIIRTNPQILVAYGAPDLAGELYSNLRSSGWAGQFAYNQMDSEDFQSIVLFDQLNGILGATTWPFAATDTDSNAFLNAYIRAFGEVPNPVAAASYDAVYLLAEAIGLPGDLRTNLAQLDNIQGTQGVLRPAQLMRGEMSDNAAIVQLGAFGAPEIRARYVGTQRLPGGEAPSVAISTPTPTSTPTPEGVVMTIESAVQNVRTGPGLEYDVLGQMRKDEQARVIGASIDFSWVVIQYRGQNGWLATYLLDVYGDLNTVPVIQPPPTPTPGPPTATPTSQPFPDIVVIGASPTTIARDIPFNITITIQNRGNVDAGTFGIATSFQPGGIYSGDNLPGLGAGQQTTINLGGTVTGATGPQSIVIVVDLNSQVDEGPAGEANNSDYAFNYMVDRTILNAGTLTFSPNGILNLEGSGTADLMWNAAGTALDFVAPVPAGSGMYLLTGVSSISDVHYDMINPGLATTLSLNVALLPNAYIGLVTAEGNRGVIHVDNVVAGGLITLTYRVYNP